MSASSSISTEPLCLGDHKMLDRNDSYPPLSNYNMSTRPKLLLAVIASSTLFFGCSTPHHAEHWEYKTVTLSNWPAADAQLNELGAEGWVVVGFSRNEGGSNTSTFVLKRRK
jgi:hypothetical protein